MADDARSALRAIAHPVRLQILSLLTGAELSATEVARELGLTHANASYHLRVLLEAGELEIASEERIRGGIAKRYRHPWEKDFAPRQRGKVTSEERALYVRALAEELVRRARLARPARDRSQFSDAELWVSPEDYAAAAEALSLASRTLHGAARPPRSEGTIRVAFSAALFEMEPRPDGDHP
jgi:DNA-binding transcriptional ArsR family regulator